MTEVFTDNTEIYEKISSLNAGFEVKLLSNQQPEKAICILTDISNIKKYYLNYPIIIYAKEGYDKYPVLKNTSIIENANDIDSKFIMQKYNRYYGIPNIVITTERLNIREMVLDDLDELYRIYDNPSITRYMEGLYEDRTEEEIFTKNYIENMYGMYDYGLWIVEEKHTHKMLGRIGLSHRIINDEQCTELGYLIRIEEQKKGYAYEACKAIIDYAKKQLKKEELFTCIEADNLPSIKLAKKLGFKEVFADKMIILQYIL